VDCGVVNSTENCCTSYAIRTSLAIYHDGETRILGDRLMIYDWCFVNRGVQLALSAGAVQGMESRHLVLYDVLSGWQLSKWTGDFDATPPVLAKDLQQ